MKSTHHYKQFIDHLQIITKVILWLKPINRGNDPKLPCKQQQCCVPLFILEHYNRNDRKQMRYEHIHKIPYNIRIQKMDKFCHLLFLIKRTMWQTWSASRLPWCRVWNSVTHKWLHQSRCLSTPWKDQDTYYNIFHRAGKRFDL
jgi:hypothetical protein